MNRRLGSPVANNSEPELNYLFSNLPNQRDVKSSLISKNIMVGERRTSVSLEPEMWTALKDIARREKCSANDICTLRLSFAVKKKKAL